MLHFCFLLSGKIISFVCVLCSASLVWPKFIPKLLPAEIKKIDFILQDALPSCDEMTKLCVIVNQRVGNNNAPEEKVNMEIKRLLMETNEDFENMF